MPTVKSRSSRRSRRSWVAEPWYRGRGARSAANGGRRGTYSNQSCHPQQDFLHRRPQLKHLQNILSAETLSAWSASVGPQKCLSRPPNQSKIRPQYSRFDAQSRLRNATLRREVAGCHKFMKIDVFCMKLAGGSARQLARGNVFASNRSLHSGLYLNTAADQGFPTLGA